MCVGGRWSLYTAQLSQEEGSGTGFGEQLPAMLKTSGNCGENHAAFLRPISLDRPVGNGGQ